MPDKVTNYCISGLPLLLQCKDVYNLFVNCGGIAKLGHYVHSTLHRRPTLKALMVIVILEERLTHDSSSSGGSSGDSLLGVNTRLSDDSSRRPAAIEQPHAQSARDKRDHVTVKLLLQLLLDTDVQASSSQSDQQEFSCDLTEPLPTATASHPADVTAGLEPSVSLSDRASTGGASSASVNIPVRAMSDSEFRTRFEHLLSHLSLLCDVWDCANVLFHQSASFKHQFLQAGGAQRAYDVLLRLVLTANDLTVSLYVI